MTSDSVMHLESVKHSWKKFLSLMKRNFVMFFTSISDILRLWQEKTWQKQFWGTLLINYYSNNESPSKFNLRKEIKSKIGTYLATSSSTFFGSIGSFLDDERFDFRSVVPDDLKCRRYRTSINEKIIAKKFSFPLNF